MDREFKYLMKLFINGAIGEKTDISSDVDINNILEMAKKHNIYYSVVHSLLISDGCGAELDEELSSRLKLEIQNVRMITVMRQTKFAGIFGKMEENNIRYALLKGYSVARFYDDPYSRLSSDVDVLVEPEGEDKAIDILLQHGFEMKKRRTGEEKDSILTHPVLGVVELHVALYNKKTSAVWFNADNRNFDVEINHIDFENLEKIEINGDVFYTLGIDKRIEYLFMHNAKHFIFGGSSIRAMMDFFLMYVKCRDIDYHLFEDKLDEWNMRTLFNTMISFLEKFISFDEFDVPAYQRVDDELIKCFAEDMYEGQWLGYGSNDDSAKVGRDYFVIYKMKLNGQKDSSLKYIMDMLFPPVAKLKNNYKYASLHSYFVPVAWFHRILKIITGRSKVKKRKKNIDSSNGRRIEVLKKMNII